MNKNFLILPHQTLPESIKQSDDTPAVERLRNKVADRTVDAIVLGYVGAVGTGATFFESVNSNLLMGLVAGGIGVVCTVEAAISQYRASYYAHAVHRVEMTCPQNLA